MSPTATTTYSLSCSGSGGTATQNVSIGVAPIIVSTTSPIGSDEPTYNAANQTLLFQDDFNYTTFAQANAAGWRGTDGANTSDTRFTSDPLGSNKIISGGYDGTGNAMRLEYFGVETNTGTNQEARSWSRLQPDTLAANPGHTFYMTFYTRINPGGGYALDQDARHIVQIKWLELWNTTSGSRAEFDTSYSRCYNDVPFIGAGGSGTMWNFYGNSAGGTQCQAGQARAPFAYQGTNQWHRTTYKYVTRSSSNAQDGVAQMWYDGTLILSNALGYCGAAVPGSLANFYGQPPHWCESEDLNTFFVNETVSKITLGSVMTGSLWPFSIDYDHMSMWRD